MIIEDYNKIPSKPTVDGEARYENSHEIFAMPTPHGRKIKSHQVRKAAYNTILSGLWDILTGAGMSEATMSPQKKS